MTEWTCAADGAALTAPTTEAREMDGLMVVVTTDPGNAAEHLRTAHPERWRELCDQQRRMNAGGRYGMPRRMDGSFLPPGEDVI